MRRCCVAQLVVLQAQDDLDSNAQGLAKGCGNHNPAILADAQTDFVRHGKLLLACLRL